MWVGVCVGGLGVGGCLCRWFGCGWVSVWVGVCVGGLGVGRRLCRWFGCGWVSVWVGGFFLEGGGELQCGYIPREQR